MLRKAQTFGRPLLEKQQLRSSVNPVPQMLGLYRNIALTLSNKPYVLWRKDDHSPTLSPKNREQLGTWIRECAPNPKEGGGKSGGGEKQSNDGLFRGIWGNNKGTKKNGGGDDEDEDDKLGQGRGGDQVMRHYFFGTLFLLGLTLGFYYLASPSGPNVTWEEAAGWSDQITSICLYEHYVQFYLETGHAAHIGLTNSTQRTDQLMKTLTKLKSDISVTYVGWTYSENILTGLGTLLWLLPILFFPIYSLGMARLVSSASSQQAGQSSKLSKKMFSVTRKTNTKFKDIAGMHEAKSEVREVVDFLKNPAPYHKLGAKIPSGALLLGPPGTGKTLLAKAVAGEAGVSFIPTNGSDFVELYVGMGALRVRELFQLAKKQEGRVIIYIDELDAIGLKRRGAGHGEKQEQEHTLNELLTQLDGFNTEENKVLVLASSNVGQDSLDPALIRPGRFDRIIHVDAPVLSERKEIFAVHMDSLKLLEPVPVELPELDVLPGSGLKKEDIPPELAASVKADLEEHLQENPNASINSIKVVKVSINDADGVAAAVKTAHEETKRELASQSMEKTPTTAENVAESDNVTSETEEPILDRKAKEEVEKSPMELFKEEKDDLVAKYAARMSDLCPGFVGADISNVCNEAAILAARNNDPLVTIDHLEKSIDRVIAGIEMRSRVLSNFEKEVVAHHEAGHAIAGWYLNRADPLMKVSIVPRGGKALGYAQYLPSENNLRSGKDVVDSMCVALGGRVAESIYFKHLSTGASDDLLKVTRMAYQHVSAFSETGMAHTPPGRSTPYRKPYGDTISDKLDVAAQKIVDQAYQRTFELLTTRKEEMTKLAQHLLKHEVLTHQDVVDYLGQREPRKSDFRLA